MKSYAFSYETRENPAQICDRLTDESVKVIAGGQSLGPMLNLRLARADTLIDVSRVPRMRGYQVRDDGIIIGAAITHAEIEDGLLPDTTLGILPRIASGIAYRAVRSRGTIGGSLAHADPAADWVSSLCALDAQVILQRADQGESSTRRMPLTAFLRGTLQTALEPGELLVAVFVPKVPSASRFGYFKLCRKTGELAHAIGVVYANGDTGVKRSVMGALAGAPIAIEGDDAFDRERWQQALNERATESDEIDHALRINVLQRALDRSDVL